MLLKKVLTQITPLGMFNMFSGKAAERLIISLKIMPYIRHLSLWNFLPQPFPALGKMKKRDGMVKYMQIIRYATIGITIVQAVGVSVTLVVWPGRSGESAVMLDMTTFSAVCSYWEYMLAGTMLLMWIGEQITPTRY